jgi:uncharacterized protein YjbI with pentapeptide repeats
MIRNFVVSKQFLCGKEKTKACDLSGVCLFGADLREAVFEGAILTRTNMEMADLTDAIFRGNTNLAGATLEAADLTGVQLIDANFMDASVHGPELERVNFAGATLTGVVLQNAKLYGANFGLRFVDGKNVPTLLIKADLKGADLRFANLSMAKMQGANLVEVNFTYANLTSANLACAVMMNTDFTDAILTTAQFKDTQFENEEKKNKRLTRVANLQGAIMENTVFHESRNIHVARFDAMPPLSRPRRPLPLVPWYKRMVKAVFAQGNSDDVDEEADEDGEEEASEEHDAAHGPDAEWLKVDISEWLKALQTQNDWRLIFPNGSRHGAFRRPFHKWLTAPKNPEEKLLKERSSSHREGRDVFEGSDTADATTVMGDYVEFANPIIEEGDTFLSDLVQKAATDDSGDLISKIINIQKHVRGYLVWVLAHLDLMSAECSLNEMVKRVTEVDVDSIKKKFTSTLTSKTDSGIAEQYSVRSTAERMCTRYIFDIGEMCQKMIAFAEQESHDDKLVKICTAWGNTHKKAIPPGLPKAAENTTDKGKNEGRNKGGKGKNEGKDEGNTKGKYKEKPHAEDETKLRDGLRALLLTERVLVAMATRVELELTLKDLLTKETERACRAKAVFLLRTSPLTTQYKVYQEAVEQKEKIRREHLRQRPKSRSSDERNDDEEEETLENSDMDELEALLSLIGDWFKVAARIKGILDELQHQSYWYRRWPNAVGGAAKALWSVQDNDDDDGEEEESSGWENGEDVELESDPLAKLSTWVRLAYSSRLQDEEEDTEMAFETEDGADGEHEAVESADDVDEGETPEDQPGVLDWRPGLVFQSTRELSKEALERQQEAILVHSTESALTVKSKYLAMGWPEAVTQVLMYDTKDMNGDLKELVFLLVQLEGLTSPINATNWDDALETWLSLCQLPRKMRGERSRMVLTQIFDSEPLKAAIGMANQLTEIQRGENSKYVPDGLVSRFKRHAGAHIKVRIVFARH